MIQNASTAGYADNIRKVVVQGFFGNHHISDADRQKETDDEKVLRCCILVQNAWRSIQAHRNFAALKQAAVCKEYRESHPENLKVCDRRDPSKVVHKVVIRGCKACSRDSEAAVQGEKLDRALYSEVYHLLFENHLRISVQDTGNNWNERFQLALAMPEATQADRILKYKCTSSLNSDFLSCATTYAKIIISEHFLHAKDKCISEASKLGGQAGGAKYLWRGILFKLADGNIGPWNSSDESAAKGAAHDLKGVNHYLAAASSGAIHVPLMALIDYKGFRMTAQAVLPLGFDSLVYGSNDAGKTVHTDPRFHDAMQNIADKLNLRAHQVGRDGDLKELYSAVDIEGHKGDDGRLYILDLARAFPPEAPEKTKHLNALYPNGSRVLIPIDDPNYPGSQTEVTATIVRGYDTGEYYDVVMNIPNSYRKVLVERVPSKHITDSRIGIFHRLLRPEYVKTRGVDLIPLDTRDFEGPLAHAPYSATAAFIMPPRPPPPTTTTATKAAAFSGDGYGAFGSSEMRSNGGDKPSSSSYSSSSSASSYAAAEAGGYSSFGNEYFPASPATPAVSPEPYSIDLSGYGFFNPSHSGHGSSSRVEDNSKGADGDQGPAKSYEGYEYFGSTTSYGNPAAGYSTFTSQQSVSSSSAGYTASGGDAYAYAYADGGGGSDTDLPIPPPPAKTARRSPVPLSADALSSFSRYDPQAYIRNREVSDATERLILKVIPQLAKKLAEMTPESFGEIDDLGAYIHSYGVNMRHLGVLRYNVSSANDYGINVRRNLLLQIVGRTLKNILRDFQRRWMKSERSTSEQGMFNLIAHFFNLIVGSHRKSELFWEDQVVVGVVQRFGRISFTNDEEQENLQEICSEPAFLKELVFFVSKSVGIVIVPLTVQQFAETEEPYGYTFSIHDILELVPKTRNMHIVDYQVGKLLQLLGEGISEYDAKRMDESAGYDIEDDTLTQLLERLNLFAASKLRVAERSLPSHLDAWKSRNEVERRLNEIAVQRSNNNNAIIASDDDFDVGAAGGAVFPVTSSSAIVAAAAASGSGSGSKGGAFASGSNSAAAGAVDRHHHNNPNHPTTDTSSSSSSPAMIGGGFSREIQSQGGRGQEQGQGGTEDRRRVFHRLAFKRKGAKRFSFTGSIRSTCKQS